MSNFLSGTVTAHLTFEESFERSTPTYELPVLHHPQPSYVCKYQHCMKDTRFKTSIEKAFHDQKVLGIHCVVCHKYYSRKLVLEPRAHYIKHHPEYLQNYLEQERRMKDAYAKAQADQEAQQAQAEAQAQCQYQRQQQYQATRNTRLIPDTRLNRRGSSSAVVEGGVEDTQSIIHSECSASVVRDI